jgi:hypothetical protein
VKTTSKYRTNLVDFLKQKIMDIEKYIVNVVELESSPLMFSSIL